MSLFEAVEISHAAGTAKGGNVSRGSRVESSGHPAVRVVSSGGFLFGWKTLPSQQIPEILSLKHSPPISLSNDLVQSDTTCMIGNEDDCSSGPTLVRARSNLNPWGHERPVVCCRLAHDVPCP
jgi:hypothetical protein